MQIVRLHKWAFIIVAVGRILEYRKETKEEYNNDMTSAVCIGKQRLDVFGGISGSRQQIINKKPTESVQTCYPFFLRDVWFRQKY